MKLKPGIKLLYETEGIGSQAEKGDLVNIRLNGWLNKGQQIQKNYVATITLGARTVISGIEYAIEGMKNQGMRKIIISPYLGYGEEGVKDLIPPNALLIYEIELLDIKSKT